MTRNDLLTRLVARIAAELPDNLEMSDVPLGAFCEILADIAADPVPELAPHHPVVMEKPATLGERVMLEAMFDTVGPYWGHDGCHDAQARWLSTFDDIDAEARHLLEAARDEADGDPRRI